MSLIINFLLLAKLAIVFLPICTCQEQNILDLQNFNIEDTEATKIIYQTQIHTITKTEYLPYTSKPTKVAKPFVYKENFINQHNNYRSLHGAKKLAWSDELFEQCDAFITNEFQVCDGNIHHSAQCADGEVGEIITIGFKSVEEFMSNIYATSEAFNFSNYEDLNPATSKFFKQLVWNSTSKFACSMLDCGDYFSNIIICQYDNPIDSDSVSENVFPPLKHN
ncbi:hypothetical protein ACO0SA_001791 [Hanseniaspora valbyensis]